MAKARSLEVVRRQILCMARRSDAAFSPLASDLKAPEIVLATMIVDPTAWICTSSATTAAMTDTSIRASLMSRSAQWQPAAT
eukprot:232321-Heterocapsa_arctica.AAC.1